MLTRLWQHRYYGLLAMFLLGLSAAVIVMLLPDRQQAFARFSLTPAAVAALTPAGGAQQPLPALLDNELLVAKVLQRFEIEAPNPVDPRPVDPIDAYKRNFALRRTAAGGEFEISYVGRSAEKAQLGVTTWLQAAREVLAQNGVAVGGSAANNPEADTAGTTEAVASAQAALQRAQAELATSGELEAQRVAERDKLQAELAALRTQLEQLDARQVQADAERERSARDQLDARTQAREQQLAAAQAQLNEATAAVEQTRTAWRAATAQLQQAQQALDKAKTRRAASADTAGNRKALQTSLRQLERQRTAIQREHDQAGERVATLTAQLAGTPARITEIVPVPVAPRDRELAQRLSEAEAELAAMRVRFTDNHPDVRRQLAQIAELKAAAGEQRAAANAGTRTVTKPNPEHRLLQDQLTEVQSRQADLRERLEALQRSRTQLEVKLAAAGAASGPDAAELARLNDAVTESQALVTRTNAEQEAAARALTAAQAALRAAQQDDGNKVAAAAEPAQTAATRRERAALVSQISRVEAALAKARSIAQTAQQDSAAAASALERARQALEQAQQASAAGKATEAAPTQGAAAGLLMLSPLQIVPASSNPDRPYWLWVSLLGSLILGALVALLASLRPSGIHSVRELEKITGLRALGGVPRFASRGRTVRLMFSLLFFLALVVVYGLIYIAFIGVVDSGSELLNPDWAALLDWARQGAAGLASRLGLDPAHPAWQWLWPEGITGS